MTASKIVSLALVRQPIVKKLFLEYGEVPCGEVMPVSRLFWGASAARAVILRVCSSHFFGTSWSSSTSTQPRHVQDYGPVGRQPRQRALSRVVSGVADGGPPARTRLRRSNNSGAA